MKNKLNKNNYPWWITVMFIITTIVYIFLNGIIKGTGIMLFIYLAMFLIEKQAVKINVRPHIPMIFIFIFPFISFICWFIYYLIKKKKQKSSNK